MALIPSRIILGAGLVLAGTVFIAIAAGLIFLTPGLPDEFPTAALGIATLMSGIGVLVGETPKTLAVK